MSGVAFTLYLSTFLSLFFITSQQRSKFLHLAVWSDRGFASEQVSMFLVKISCIVSLVLGTYTLNKDMFIFFKSAAAERMRDRWLRRSSKIRIRSCVKGSERNP